jgi:hypothetical protein
VSEEEGPHTGSVGSAGKSSPSSFCAPKKKKRVASPHTTMNALFRAGLPDANRFGFVQYGEGCKECV